MSRCIECDCELIRTYKCPHDCFMCEDMNPEEEED